MDLQPRAPKHGARRHHANAEACTVGVVPFLATAKSGGITGAPALTENWRGSPTAGLAPDDIRLAMQTALPMEVEISVDVAVCLAKKINASLQASHSLVERDL